MNKFSGLWDIKPVPLKTSGPYSCAIVLGGFSSEGKNGEGFFNTSADRFIQGLKLLSTGQVSHILISGGNGNLIPDSFEEGDWVKTQLKLFKVPDSCILIEDRSRNTIENAAFTKPILQKAALQPPYLLVTSAFHMRRSLGIFKATGINVIPYSCNYLPGTGSTNISIGDFIPDGSILGTWDYYIKEAIGTLVNKFR
ncbi:MAG TPA: YdcF family protein [Mucilaginibacter sp.]|nr:YdcF family protein [Mucilaginibacter sp.]